MRRGNKGQPSVLECLKLFTQRTEELANLPVVQSGMQWNVKCGWSAEAGFHYEEHGIDEDALRSLLMLFRQFVSTVEPVSLNRIFNQCDLYLGDPQVKGELRKAINAWQTGIKSGVGGLRPVVNGQELTPEYVLDLWFYGHHFHSDADKMAALQQLLDGDELHWVRVHLLMVLPSLTEIVLFVGGAVRRSLAGSQLDVPSKG